MKRVIVLTVVFSVFFITTFSQPSTFLRLYTLSGNRMHSGKFVATTDSSIVVLEHGNTVEVPIRGISKIKTRRSVGHNVMLPALIGALSFGLLGMISGEPKENNGTFAGSLHDALSWTPAEGAAKGTITGAIIGSATGATISLLSKRSIYRLDGLKSSWDRQRLDIVQLPKLDLTTL